MTISMNQNDTVTTGSTTTTTTTTLRLAICQLMPSNSIADAIKAIDGFAKEAFSTVRPVPSYYPSSF